MIESVFYKIASSEEDFQLAKSLFMAYEASLDFKIDFQDFDKEIKEIPKQYAVPSGVLILAFYKNRAIGCIALRKFEPEIGELKRMFVKPEFRGKKIGFELLFRCIEEARNLGYKKLRLDTMTRMKKALEMYLNFDFYEIPAYRFNPLKDAVYLEKTL